MNRYVLIRLQTTQQFTFWWKYSTYWSGSMNNMSHPFDQRLLSLFSPSLGFTKSYLLWFFSIHLLSLFLKYEWILLYIFLCWLRLCQPLFAFGFLNRHLTSPGHWDCSLGFLNRHHTSRPLGLLFCSVLRSGPSSINPKGLIWLLPGFSGLSLSFQLGSFRPFLITLRDS